MKIILSTSENKDFEPFERFAHLNENKHINELIDEFKILRYNNLKILKSFIITEEKFSLTGVHPEFGNVTLKQLISTWAVHDLGHISQITRVMAKQYLNEVGPWINYLSILTHQNES